MFSIDYIEIKPQSILFYLIRFYFRKCIAVNNSPQYEDVIIYTIFG